MQTSAPATFRAHGWRQYLGRAILVVVGIEVGLVLLTLPWTRLWEHSFWIARLLPAHPHWWRLAHSPYLRGAISGLGLVNLWIAGNEILHFRR